MDLASPGLASLPPAFTAPQAAAAGLSRRRLRRLIDSGDVRSPRRGVLSVATSGALEDRVRAAGLVLPHGAAFSRRTAAELFGFDPRTPSERGVELALECTVPAGRTPLRQPGIRSFAAPLPPADVVTLAGVPCTDPDRTAADLLRHLPGFMALAVVDAMAHARTISLPAVDAILARYRGGRHVAKARRLLGLVEPKAESYGESWQRLRLVDAGFPRPEVQIPFFDGAGREIYRLDMGYPELRLGLEYDGVEFQEGRDRREHDEARREDLRKRFGWNVIGCGRGDVLGPSMALELAVGDLLSLQPVIYRRSW